MSLLDAFAASLARSAPPHAHPVPPALAGRLSAAPFIAAGGACHLSGNVAVQ